MSEHNIKTIEMYNSGGALEYIQQQNEINPETEKWERLFNYVEEQLAKDKKKRIIEFGSGCGQLAIMLQSAGYDITATDTVDDFLKEQKRIGINQVKKYNFLLDDYNNIFDFKADLIVSWRNPHLDMDDMQRLFDVAYNALTDNGLLIINFQNADVHPNANLLPNGTKYDYKILEDKKTKEKRFFAYFSKEDIEYLRKDLFEINEYHNEGGKEQKNWHVLTLRKTKK
ncbi:MAG: class I SAM-dependent methyltransferase [Firmicutes bacterium]|nr:class I SAM-dependent methyltransferase [Bacillota bacterium]